MSRRAGDTHGDLHDRGHVDRWRARRARRTDDGFIDQGLRMPPELGGPGGATNPEQLFAAAYAACFHGALRLAARTRKEVVPDDVSVTATVRLEPDDVSFQVAADTVDGGRIGSRAALSCGPDAAQRSPTR